MAKGAKTKVNRSELQLERMKYKPELPEILKGKPAMIKAVLGKATEAISDKETVKELFDHVYGGPIVTFGKGANKTVRKSAVKIGVVLSGGGGGHNVGGAFDGLKKANKSNRLIGFLGGPSGLIENKFMEITSSLMDDYRNTGGFDMIQSGRTKIETPEQFTATKNSLLKNKIDALVVVGGDDSNTNAALLAEYFKKENAPINVIGVPKTIDGDLKNKQIETSFGFDTATKIYAELVGNICRDVNSARKYWHFVRLMEEVARTSPLKSLKTQPNITLIGEEVLAKNMTLAK